MLLSLWILGWFVCLCICIIIQFNRTCIRWFFQMGQKMSQLNDFMVYFVPGLWGIKFQAFRYTHKHRCQFCQKMNILMKFIVDAWTGKDNLMMRCCICKMRLENVVSNIKPPNRIISISNLSDVLFKRLYTLTSNYNVYCRSAVEWLNRCDELNETESKRVSHKIIAVKLKLTFSLSYSIAILNECIHATAFPSLCYFF